MRLTGNTILIIGGTSGIGRALAEAFHRLGNQVIIAGRRQALIDKLTAGNPGMRGMELDVREAPAVAAFATEIREQFPKLNVLINNAGISVAEDLTTDTQDISVALSIVQTNVISVLQLTAALLPTLKQQPNSTIITTSSGLAFVPRSKFPAYCASKAFLHSWLQSLRFQLRETSVEVLELAPPYVQTELAGSGQATDPHAMPLADFIAEVMEILADLPAGGEILVERVKALRWAEKNNNYDRMFNALNER
ncbi:SDR family oxidoreductase [Mesorhizobium sp. M0199]|uniref:SDR family oxidoreductase n=1 Tax=Mesorhizobium sp. M0199 TaxID=2956911 RepID=UPI00333CB7EA